MLSSPMSDAHKRALVVAYYLSRFDRKGIRALGYETAMEAFARLSEQLGVKASTLKQMRDSFDPYCSHVRVGWYQRPILRSRANVIQAYDELSEAAVAEIVKEILKGTDSAIDQFTDFIGTEDAVSDFSAGENSAFANRIRTGETAEIFFMEQFTTLPTFQGSTLEDTRKFGIGFDFRALFSSYYQVIEVKGVREAHGYITFTDKEWSVAQQMKQNYILALVSSLDKQPKLVLISNPTTVLVAKMRSVESVSVCWNTKV